MRPRYTHRQKKAGFTLIEAMIALGIMSLLMLGMMQMFIGSLRMAARTNAEVSASLDASRAMRHIFDEAREASIVYVPGDTNNTTNHSPTNAAAVQNFVDGAYLCLGSTYKAASLYQSSDGNGNTVDTALLLVTPNASTITKLGTSAGTVLYPSSANTSMYDRSTPGGAILIYRSDAGGIPDGQNGTYLYEVSANGSPSTATKIMDLCEHKGTTAVGPAPVWNAVQLVRPNGTSSPFEIEVKIISSYYSPIDGHQTSETTGSTSVTALTGKCVFMRDHQTSGTTPSQTDAGGNRFRSS